MKYQYNFSEIVFRSGRKDLVIEVEDKIKLVGSFLMSDIQSSDPDYVFEAIDNVLSGKSEYEELNGNMCGVEISKEFTKIYNNLAEDGMGNWCSIETSELREFVYIWSKKIKEFK